MPDSEIAWLAAGATANVLLFVIGYLAGWLAQGTQHHPQSPHNRREQQDMIKLLLRAGVAGVVTAAAIYAFKEFQLADRAVVLANEVLTRIAGSENKEPTSHEY